MSYSSSYKLSSSLNLVRQLVPVAAKPKVVDLPVNHIVVIDCSGSMYDALPRIRQHLKNKLPMLLREKDTISIIWFSGRNEYGVLVENVEVKSLTDFSSLNGAIDRWLRAVGLTGFKQPLEEVGGVLNRIAKTGSTSLNSLFFMSDGYDNQWSQKEILKAVSELQTRLSSAVFVEYGYYCNRPLMTAMAEQAGGTLIFSEDFPRYEPVLENALSKRLGGAKKVEIDLDAVPEHGLIFGMVGGDLLTFALQNGKVLVPENVGSLFYLSKSSLTDGGSLEALCKAAALGNPDEVVSAMYGAIALCAQRMKADSVFALLKVLGDAALITQFANCFGKQKYSDFQEVATKCAFGAGKLFADGYNPKLVPPDDAFTVIDLLKLLTEEDGNTFHPDHELFEYARIGRATVDAGSVLTEDEQKQVTALTEQMKGKKKPADIKAIQEQINAILDKKTDALKFTADPAPRGYSVSNLTLNEERPNVSALVKKTGTVDLSSRLTPELRAAGVPEKFPTVIHRNYNIIRDGIINNNILPASLEIKTFDKLVGEGVIPAGTAYDPDQTYMLDLRALPIINRKMVAEVSAERLFELSYELLKLKGDQKVYNDYLKKNFPKTSTGFAAKYGEAAAKWLAEQGLTEYNGFSPKVVKADATDFYMGKEIKVSLKGLSSLPTLKDLAERLDAMKKDKTKSLTPAMKLMAGAYKDVQDFLDSAIYKQNEDKNALFETWLKNKAKAATSRVRELMYALAQIKFSVVVGQVWFKEFSSLDENSMSLKFDGHEFDCKVELKEIEVKI